MAEAHPIPQAACGGRSHVLQGHPASCQKTVASDKLPRAKAEQQREEAGAPTGDTLVSGPERAAG